MLFIGHCQTNSIIPKKTVSRVISSLELTPLGQSGSPMLFEDVASVEIALVIEVVVDRGMDGCELLQGLYIPESRHRLWGAN